MQFFVFFACSIYSVYGRRAFRAAEVRHASQLSRLSGLSIGSDVAAHSEPRRTLEKDATGLGGLLFAMPRVLSHGKVKFTPRSRGGFPTSPSPRSRSGIALKPRKRSRPSIAMRHSPDDVSENVLSAYTQSPPKGIPAFDQVMETSKNNQASTNYADDFQDKDLWGARAVIMTCAALYGTNFASVKMLDESLDPSMAALLRFTLAAMIFAPHLITKGLKNPAVIAGGREVGFFVWLGYVTQAISLQSTPASIVAFICSLSVIVVPLLDAMFQNDHAQVQHGKNRWAALWPALIATAGVASLELGGATTPGVGDLWALGQPLFFGLGFWRVEHYMQKLHKEGEAEAFTGSLLATISFLSIFWAARDWAYPVMHSAEMQGENVPIALGQALSSLAPVLQDWHVLAAIAWTGVVTTALTTFGENYAMKSLSSSETTVIFSTEPLWGTAFAALTLGESVGQNTFIGAILILTACMWSSFDSLAPALRDAIASLAGLLGEQDLAEGTKTKMVSSKILELQETMDSLGLVPPDDLPPIP